MAEVVANTMTSCQSDFEKYDTDYIKGNGVKAFPFLWMVAPSHTYLLKLANFKEEYFNNETLRYDIAHKNSWFHAYLWPCCSEVKEDIYYVTLDGIRSISVEQARETVRDTITPVIKEWEQLYGEIPEKSKISVEIHGISLTNLKTLVQDCRNHGNDSLMNCLRRFKNYRQIAKNHKISVRYSERYNEFSFCELVNDQQKLCGGIVFHGWPETGYQTNGSVQIQPQYGWSLHT